MSQPPLDVPALLKRYALRPDKRLGQNFLTDPAALERVVETAEVKVGDTILEVGPGLGSLTRLLAARARRVVAVEIDTSLIKPLEEVLSIYPNVQVVRGDILGLDPAQLMADQGYLVVANIPYYITSNLIRHLLEARIQPKRMVLTVQREVAERITARPGAMSLLALSVQVFGQPTITARIPAGAFYPAPKVDSAVVRVDLFNSPQIPASQLASFFRLAKAGFSQKRKMLRNALAGGMHWTPAQAEAILQAAGIDPQRRAETIRIDEWGQIVDSYQAWMER